MKFQYQILICCTLICMLSAAVFYQLDQKPTQKSKPLIVCTTTIIADAITNIAQDTIELVSLMGPGIDPHLYKPVESDLLKIASADIIFYNGLHLEARLAHLLEQLSKTQVTIAISKDIPQSKLIAIASFEKTFDPHIWFDVTLWISVIKTIYKTLVDHYPEHSNIFEINTQKYIKELEQLFMQTHRIMAQIPQEKRVIITGHDAFSYFARQYNCKVIGLQGMSTESTPGAYDLQKIIDIICQQKIPAIFVESSIPIKNVLALQEGVIAQGKSVNLGGEIFSDALGPKNSIGDTYITMMQHNVQTIASALIN